MNLTRKGNEHTHRGIIGIESAIVLIAFVIVAAALAFVVLNMGFSTTQKAKTTIIAGLNEASSGLEVSGKVIGIGCTTSCGSNPTLNVTSIPLKVASGGDSVNLDPTLTSVKYLSNSVEYDDIYECVVNDSSEYIDITSAFAGAISDADCTSFNAASDNPVDSTGPGVTRALTYWSVNTNDNTILDQGEHAVLAIAYDSSPDERPQALDKIRAEVIVATGASLTVERQVPNITNFIVDMG